MRQMHRAEVSATSTTNPIENEITSMLATQGNLYVKYMRAKQAEDTSDGIDTTFRGDVCSLLHFSRGQCK